MASTLVSNSKSLGSNPSEPAIRGNMSKLIIDLLSDTHDRHEQFKCEGGDILLHAGDITGRGGPTEIMDFLEWYAEQKYEHKIMIPGNHDFGLERDFEFWKEKAAALGITMLNDSGIIIKSMTDPDLNMKIWGSPVQPWFHNWAYNRHRTQEAATEHYPWIKPHWDLIPVDTEILVTHGPPHGILDQVNNRLRNDYDPKKDGSSGLRVGCEELLKKINETNVKLHVFGHIHEGRGFHYEGDRTFVNASSLDRSYYPADKKPIRVIREKTENGKIVYVV